MKRSAWILIALLGMLSTATIPAGAQTTAGVRLFEQHCVTCHGNPKSTVAAPDVLSLWKLTPEAVYAAFSKGPHTTLTGITDDDKREIASYFGGRKVDIAQIADANLMPNKCPGNSSISTNDLSGKPSWNGWGNGATDARFQPADAAALPADQVPQLKLKWAFGFPGADEVYGQPTIAAGRVFLGVDTGAVYSLDAATGCVYWSFQATAGVRSAISVGPVEGQGTAKVGVYFGDIRANVYMLDAITGKRLWKVNVEDHPVARFTGAPSLYPGRL